MRKRHFSVIRYAFPTYLNPVQAWTLCEISPGSLRQRTPGRQISYPPQIPTHSIQREPLTNPWIFSLCNRIQARSKTLQNSLNSVQRFDGNLEEHFTWLGKVETQLRKQDEMTTRDVTPKSDEEHKRRQQQYKVRNIAFTPL